MKEIVEYAAYIIGALIFIANFGMAIEWYWLTISKIIKTAQTANAKFVNPYQTYPQKIKRFLIDFSALITSFIVLIVLIIKSPPVTMSIVLLCCNAFFIISIYVAGFAGKRLKKEMYAGLRYIAASTYVPPDDPANEGW